jgi:undecaprenyl-diphosphatase
LSLPTIAGAGLLKTIDLVQSGDAALGSDAVIVAVLSAVLAWLAIRWMMGWLAVASFGIFVYYRLVLGGLLLLALTQGWIAPSIT